MLDDFQHVLNLSLSLGQVITNISVAFLCGMLIFMLYRHTYRGPGYSIDFLNSLVILAMVTAVVIMVIGNNLARAFGLVGAMSIIRFRTAVKDTRDIIFIFFSLAIGMAAGVGFHAIAITSTLTISAIFLLLTRINLVPGQKREFLLQFNVTSNGEHGDPEYLSVLHKYCRSNKLINVKSTNNGAGLELSYYVSLKKESQNAEFVKHVKQVKGVDHVNLFIDEEEF